MLFWIHLERRKKTRKKTEFGPNPLAAVGRTTNDEGGKKGPNLRPCDANAKELGERNYDPSMRAARERESDLFKQVGSFVRINTQPCNYRSECCG